MNDDLIDEWKCIENMENIEEYSKENILTLSKLSQSTDPEIRLRTAEVLCEVPLELSESLLISLLKDKDELVRASACDSLGRSENIYVYSLLKDIVLHDTSFIVKNYAILAIVDVVVNINADPRETLKLLEQIIQHPCKELVKISSFRGLYLLGKTEYLVNLFEELSGNIYQNRCATINMLKEIMNDENQEMIKSALFELKQTELSAAVLSSIDRVLSIL